MRRCLLILACLGAGACIWLVLRRHSGSTPTPVQAHGPTATVVFRIVDANDDGVAGALVGEARADRAGVCELQVAPETESKIRVSCAGYCPAEFNVGPLEASAKLERWVRLERGHMLEARVCIAATTQPVGGAHVRLDVLDGPVDAESPRFSTTDEDGLVHFEDAPSSFVKLTVVPPRYSSQPYCLQLVPGRAPDPILIGARRSTHVVAEIVDSAGNPSRDARVWTCDRGVWSAPSMAEHGLFETDVEAGRTCWIAALDVSWAFGTLQLTGDGHERKDRIVLTPAREIRHYPLRVRVIDDETQDGISGAQVRLARFLDWGGPASDGLQPSMRTDAAGWLVIDAFPFREVNVEASHEGYETENVTLIADDPNALTGEIRLSPIAASRTITCRAEHPVNVHWPWQENGSDGTIKLRGFSSDDNTSDIQYRPNADIARECVLRTVPIGSHNVELPVYPMGDLVVRCTDADGHPLPRACIAVEGDGFAGNVLKADSRGEFLLRDLPAGEGTVWVAAWGHGEAGPFPYVLPQGGRVDLNARFGPRLALLAVHLRFVDGRPASGFQVLPLDPAGKLIDVISERFCAEPWGSPTFETWSDGRCSIPLPPQELTVAFRGVVHPSHDASWGEWGGPFFGSTTVVVPRAGLVDVDLTLDWTVFVSGMDPEDAPSDFQRGDVVLTWDRKKVRDVDDCTPSQGPVPVTVRRGADIIELKVPPGPQTAIFDRMYFVVR